MQSQWCGIFCFDKCIRIETETVNDSILYSLKMMTVNTRCNCTETGGTVWNDLKKSVTGFGFKLVKNTNTLFFTIYRIILNGLYVNNTCHLDDCGLSYVWYNQAFRVSKEQN